MNKISNDDENQDLSDLVFKTKWLSRKKTILVDDLEINIE